MAEVARPVRQLIGAVKVDLVPGQTRTVTAALNADLTACTGRSSEDVHATVRFTLTGPRRHVGFDQAPRSLVRARRVTTL